MNLVDKRRREFFGQAAAIASTLVAPGLMLYEYAQAKAPADPVSGKVRWGMLIDTTKCAPGCRDCVDACNRENGLPGTTRTTDSQWIRKVDLKDLKTGKAVSIPVLCQHCAEPPCVYVCPTGASFKREDGIVLQIALPAGTYRLHFRSNYAHSFGNWFDLPPDTLFWGIALFTVGEDAAITTRKITPSLQERLLPAQVPPTTPPISKLEYAILWTCLAILLSALAVIPVVLWRVKSSGGTIQLARRWTKVAAWAAWFNSLLCSLLTFVLMIIIDLETIVLQPIVITSTSGMQGRIFTGVFMRVFC